MSNDVLTTQEAATLLLAVDVNTTVAQSIAVVLNRLAELETGEVTTVWAITWPGDVVVEEHSDKDSAERAARSAGDGAYVVSAESRRGPWTQATA